METNQPLDRGFAEGMQLSHESKSFLQETAKWSRFLAILGFISLGLMILMGLFIGTIIGYLGLGSSVGPYETAIISGISVLFLVTVLIMFFPILYLYRFSANMQLALRNEDEVALTTSLSNLKSHYKFIGILTIIYLALYIIGNIFFLVTGWSAM